jgi:hypothetical protein
MIKRTCVIFFILFINQTIPLRNSGKKTMINSNKWASEWFQKNKHEFISMTDQQLKLKLRQELVMYSKIDQKTFKQILKKVLNEKKRITVKPKIFKQLYTLRAGK